eukprot:g29545.t1
MAVGPGGPGEGRVIIGLFKRGTWKVLPLAGCVVNHPSLMRAVKQLQEVFNSEGVGVFDHDSATARGIFEEESARYVELTLERPSGLVQLVIESWRQLFTSNYSRKP